MTAQSGDPRSLMYPKQGWAEETGRGRFRLMLSSEEVRIALATLEPEDRDLADTMRRLMEKWPGIEG